MDTKNNKFNALTPEILEENKSIYTEALDYAFSNDDIKNIAITGIYGAGKSSVWKTYVNKKNINNCITVSLGKYDDTEFEGNNIGFENSLERRLINQILAQIKASDIPLSKYKFKENFTDRKLNFKVLWTVLFIISILLWFIKELVIASINNLFNQFDSRIVIYGINGIMFIIPVVIFLYNFYKKNKVTVSKINLKGTEANFKEDNTDETVLDRDIKEIVYLLNCSKCNTIIFEDIDRYENTKIFTKLRELNFLLNSFIKSNGEEQRIVRFVYMLKDSLFYSKNRTKFFDFILPIVPIVDSKTSENKLVELLSVIENKPDDNVLANISLYIDDMRLLKNVVNEYIVYSKVIPLEVMDLNSNNLFALITLKNIFPYEFDLLQEDKGFIRSVFDKLELERTSLINTYQTTIENKKEEIDFINNKVVDDKFELMATMIPADVSLYYTNNESWAKCLKKWSKTPEHNEYIRYSGGSSSSFNYNEFLDSFIYNTEEKRHILEKYPDLKETELHKLYSEIEKLKLKIKDVGIYKYKKIISELSPDRIDELFLTEDNNEITQSHYFSLIRYLIVEGLVDETYWYYKGNFDIDKSKTLKRNDMVYMKNLLEAKRQDVFLEVETPFAIIKRLNIGDFNRFNILNKNILETCIKESLDENVIAITDSVDVNDEYVELAKVINCFDIDLTGKYISILLERNAEKIIEILFACTGECDNTFRNILISLLTNESISSDKLKLFSNYIEENENIISEIPEDSFDIFIDNISLSKIKFYSLAECGISVNRLKSIENSKSYYLSVNNVIYITERLLSKKIYYGNLISEVYQSKLLISTKEYIEDHFLDFIQNYITSNVTDESYCDSEDIVIRILTSNLSDDYIMGYANKNETIINDITLIKNILEKKTVGVLFDKDKIEFTKENVFNYWDLVEKYSSTFVDYINRNINKNNYEDILSINKGLCNTFINDYEVSDKLFDFVIRYADETIEKVSSKLSANRIEILVEHNLIKYTKENFKLLLDKGYYKELVSLVNSGDEDEQNECAEELMKLKLDDDIVYMLINSNISDENAIKLLKLISNSVLIEKIDSNKDVVIEEILDNELSDENIQHVSRNFGSFKFKNKFISNLIENDMLSNLNYNHLSKSFIEYILNSSAVSVDNRIDLLITIINNNTNMEQIKKYLLCIKEVSELVSIWDGKYPALDNEYKEKIADILIKKKIAKKRKDNKLMLK